MSLSARRAWIEITALAATPTRAWVALRKESVDRNRHDRAYRVELDVALRKESVDRNKYINGESAYDYLVALRKESVDRNTTCGICGQYVIGSLSARRAWIEMVSLDPVDIHRIGRSPQGERG